MGERVGKESLVHPRRGLFQANTIRYADQSCSGDEGMGGVRVPYETDSFSRLKIADLGTECFHNSDSLTSKSCRQVRPAGAHVFIESLPDKLSTTFLDI